jgi:DNA-directed RNA polymerase specialized sigma24 family protein
MTAVAGPVNGDASVADLVARARGGDQRAWDAIVERYAPLVWSICRRYRLSGADIDDAGQAVWLQLVDRLDTIRDPAARHAALREAFSHLPPRCQRLIALLIEDPPLPYAEISARLGLPAGSIGPIRGRCLDRLRRHPAIAALSNAEASTA